jgi:hypothetical protein
MSEAQNSLELTSSAEDSPARISAWPETVLDWMASGAGSGTSSVASLVRSLPVGFLSKTSLAFYPATTDETWGSSFKGWRNSGTGGPTGCLTLDTSEFPSDAGECSLSDILETPGPHLERYFLSVRACRGILRRAEKRGRELPPSLKSALEHRATATETATE